MSDSLRSKTLHALAWSFIEAVGQQGVRFIIGIILARLLFPEQFGLIGMLTIFMAVAQTFISSGFGAALIQKQDATPTDICSIFYFNIAVGLLAAGLLSAAAPWIAEFYGQPILSPLARWLSLTIVINSFGFVQTVILNKQIDFKTLTKVSVFGSIVSGLIGVAMAAAGFGVWSLVAQQITGSVFQTSALWLLNDWRPMLSFSFRSLRSMFGYGSRMLASGLLNQIFENIYLVVIGKLFSAADLGFFTRAKSLQDLPSHTLGAVVGRVTFPVFSTIQDDTVRMKKGLKKALSMLVLINFPIMIGLAVIARPLVLALLTERWAESINYFQLLCVAGLLYPLHIINLNLLQALGRSDLFFRLEIIKRVLDILNIAITWRWGISAMICGIIVTSILSYYINSYYTGVMVDYRISEQVRDFSSYLVASIVMGLAAYGAGFVPLPGYWSQLLAQMAVGIAVYVFLCRLFRLAVFMEIWQTTMNKLTRLRGCAVDKIE
jgi:O-antigen/teichoic acid export membrane protein